MFAPTLTRSDAPACVHLFVIILCTFLLLLMLASSSSGLVCYMDLKVCWANKLKYCSSEGRAGIMGKGLSTCFS